MNLPTASLGRVLGRVDSIWHPEAAAHALVYAATGAGKSTLLKSLMGLCGPERLLLVEPKRQADRAYEGPPEDPWRWGRPVDRITPRFGFEGEPGGGPSKMFYRIQGSPNREETARRFSDALEIVANEGSACLLLDDTKEVSRTLGLGDQVASILNLGRSAGILAVLATTETSYVAGRSQGAMVFTGYVGGSLSAAKSAAELHGFRGRDAQDFCGRVRRHQWIYQDLEEGSAGPVLTLPGG